MPSIRRALLVALAAVLALGCGGCGGGDAASSPKGTTVMGQIERYYAALARADGEVACGVLSEQAATGFEAVIEGPVSNDCAANIKTLSQLSELRGRPRVTKVSVNGDEATAHVSFKRPPLESDVLLSREDGQWRLSQLPAIVEGQ